MCYEHFQHHFLLITSLRLSDVCRSLHCNLDIARRSFAKWYLEPYGSNAMNDLERQQLFFPATYSPYIEFDIRTGSQAQRNSEPIRDLTSEARKRRRISSRFTPAPAEVLSPNLGRLSTTPNSPADVRTHITPDKESSPTLLDFPSEPTSTDINKHAADSYRP